MEALETAISYWEDALSAYSTKSAAGVSSLAVTTAEDAEFSRELQKILDIAYNLQGESELLFLDQVIMCRIWKTEDSEIVFIYILTICELISGIIRQRK